MKKTVRDFDYCMMWTSKINSNRRPFPIDYCCPQHVQLRLTLNQRFANTTVENASNWVAKRQIDIIHRKKPRPADWQTTISPVPVDQDQLLRFGIFTQKKINFTLLVASPSWKVVSRVHPCCLISTRPRRRLSYYLKFLFGWAELCEPLLRLLKADAVWNWSAECQRCF